MSKFDVTVGGSVYEVEAPDENTAWQWANYTHQNEQAKPSTSTERTWGEVGTDLGSSLKQGLGGLMQFPGQMYGLATGAISKPDFADTGLYGVGKRMEESAQQGKSEGLKAREAASQERVAEADKEGFWSGAGQQLKEIATDPVQLPNFLLSQSVQSIPSILAALIPVVGPAAAAELKGLQIAAKAATAVGNELAKKEAIKAMQEIAIKAGTRQAIGVGALQQGADIGSGTYEDAYKKLIADGVPQPEAASKAVNLAREAGASGAVISLLVNKFMPGASAMEKAIAGKSAGVTGRGRAALAIGAKEALTSETPEEVGGRMSRNAAMMQIDPNQTLMEGTGSTAGQAIIGGFGLGAMTGAATGNKRPEDEKVKTPEELKAIKAQEDFDKQREEFTAKADAEQAAEEAKTQQAAKEAADKIEADRLQRESTSKNLGVNTTLALPAPSERVETTPAGITQAQYDTVLKALKQEDTTGMTPDQVTTRIHDLLKDTYGTEAVKAVEAKPQEAQAPAAVAPTAPVIAPPVPPIKPVKPVRAEGWDKDATTVNQLAQQLGIPTETTQKVAGKPTVTQAEGQHSPSDVMNILVDAGSSSGAKTDYGNSGTLQAMKQAGVLATHGEMAVKGLQLQADIGNSSDPQALIDSILGKKIVSKEAPGATTDAKVAVPQTALIKQIKAADVVAHNANLQKYKVENDAFKQSQEASKAEQKATAKAERATAQAAKEAAAVETKRVAAEQAEAKIDADAQAAQRLEHAQNVYTQAEQEGHLAEKPPTGFDIKREAFKEGEAPGVFEIKIGDTVIPFEGTEAEANAKVARLQKVRDAEAAKLQKQVDEGSTPSTQKQTQIEQMEAMGKHGTPEHTQAVAEHKRLLTQANLNNTEVSTKLFDLTRTPITLSTVGNKPLTREGHTVYEGDKAKATLPTRKAAEEHILTNASEEQINTLAASAHPWADRAKEEVKRRKATDKETGKVDESVYPRTRENKTQIVEAPARPEPVDKTDLPKSGGETLWDARVDELNAILKPLLKKLGLENVGLDIVSAIKNGADGSYAAKLIKIAFDTTTPIRTLRHEGIHALKELGFFSDQQWKALEDRAKKVWVNQYLKGVVQGEGQTRYDAYVEMGLTEQELLEEAIADAFADFDATKAPPGMIAAILNRMRLLINHLKSAFTGAGYDNFADVFGKVEKGELKAGKEAAPGAAKAPSKKAGIVAEVAPHPDQEVAKKWRTLTPDQKLQTTKAVTNKTVLQVLNEMGLKGYIFEISSGKYEGEINPNIILSAPKGTSIEELSELSRVLGYVLDQKAMVSYDEHNTTSDNQSGFVKVFIPKGMSTEDLNRLRDHIAKEVPQADSDTLRDGNLLYGNFSEYNDNVETLSDQDYHQAILGVVESFDYAGKIQVSEPNRFHSELVWPGNREEYLEGTRYGAGRESGSEEGRDVRGSRRSNIERIAQEAIDTRNRWIGGERYNLRPAEPTGRPDIGGGEGRAGRAETPDTGRTGRAVQEHDLRTDREAGKRLDVKGVDGTGRGFTGFFSNISLGFKGKPNSKPYQPTLNINPIAKFVQEYNKHRGNFDDHIATSIPGFREVQTIVGDAIAKTYRSANMLDIGASEGALVKTITKLSDGRVKTVALDPNFAMAKHFNDGESVEGSTYDTSAFGAKSEEGKLAWTEDQTLTDRDQQVTKNPFAGEEVRYFSPDRKFDIVHEAMVFQFISGDRDNQIARAKELMTRDGILIIEEKFVAGNGLNAEQFRANEDKKDIYKEQYFTKAEIAAKAKAVGVAEKAAYKSEQETQEQKVTGMNDLMSSPGSIENVLSENFGNVTQFWDSGNFKGYIASDSKSAINKLLDNMLPTNSEYATVETPRVVKEEGKYSLKQGITLGKKQDGSISFSGVHYGKIKTDSLLGSKWGTGLQGAEARRLNSGQDDRIKNRVYFYIPKHDGTMPAVESGVGGHVYTQTFNNIISPEELSKLYSKVGGDANRMESAVIDAGYDGYAAPSMGMMVILNHDVPVDYQGNKAEYEARRERLSLRSVAWNDDRVNSLLSNYSYTQNGREKDTKAYAARISPKDFLDATTPPSFKSELESQRTKLDKVKLANFDQPIYLDIQPLGDGTYKIKDHEGRHRMMALQDNGVDSVPVVLHLKGVGGYLKNAEIVERTKFIPQTWVGTTTETATKGFSVEKMIPINWENRNTLKEEFGGEADIKFSLRAPDTKEFKQFFGDGKVVDADGNPLVVYHATIQDVVKFDPRKLGKNTGDATAKLGFFFGATPESTDEFVRYGAYKSVGDYKPGANVVPAYLSIQNPIEVSSTQFGMQMMALNNMSLAKAKKFIADFVAEAKAEGHDGMVIRASKTGRGLFGAQEFAADNWVAFEPTQIKSATGNTGAYSKTNPDIRYSLRAQVEALPNGAQINTRVGETTYAREEKSHAKRMIEALTPRSFSSFRQKALHRYNQAGVVGKQAAQVMGDRLLLADASAEAACLFSDNASSLAAEAMGVGRRKGGIPQFIKGTFQAPDANGVMKTNESGYFTVDNSSKGAVEIFAPLAAKGDPIIYQYYNFWAGVQRGSRFMADGTEQNFTRADIAYAKQLETLHPEFASVQKEWIKYNDGLVKMMVDAGVLTKEAGHEFTKHGDYLPFYRQLDGEATIGPNIFQSIAGVKPPKKHTGKTDAPIGDFLENVVRNTQAAIEASMKNVAGQRVLRDAETIGQAHKVHHNTKMGIDIVPVFENGVRTLYQVHDALLIESMKGLNLPQIPFLGIVSAPANLLRTMVTKDPAFMLANMMRDSLSAWVTSGASMMPMVETIANFGKGLAGMSPEVDALRRAGILGGYDFAGNVETSGREFSAAMRKFTGTKTKFEKGVTPITGVWHALEMASDASEGATRAAVYKATLAKTGNEAEALFQAMEVLNFNRKGNSAAIRLLTAAVPFLNARMQGLDLLYRAGFGQLANADAKSIQKAFFVRGATIMAMSALYYAMTHDDDDYKKQEQETRDNYWLLPSLGVKIPIPFEVGIIFKVIPERIMAYAFGSDTGQDFLNSMGRQISTTLMFNPVPQAAMPIVETVTNHSFFTGRPVVSRAMEGVAPEFQVEASTSGLAKRIGKGVGLSPIQIDHLISGYTGTMGMYMVNAMNTIFDTQDDPTRADLRFEQLPVWKRFALDKNAKGNVTAYYDLKHSTDEMTRTVNMLERTGNYEEMAKYQTENVKLLATQDYIKVLAKEMKQFQDMKMQVQSSKMDGQSKRDTLTAINQAEIALTANIQYLKKMMDQMNR